ncbi:hypothetical protein H257_03940 [Aphanomyces astaci]|uniref:C2 domain-containing protein n=1 Tax=Aphanomyces astaci TaxID=112090 RepID=W4H139_APHAT|nr:hypothetical protein H257_03940 [Aphanomyces astaci]ETV84873.1 hypothetical protein H257_03940 [Aphanomyces astaci]|eukprot:XP_009826565.1 hypothetical protein H257_03940 [Aphanomyces astaci]
MELEIQVVEARNLASINILGKPNPMCALVMGNHTFSTKGNSNARAPTWHETFTIPITDANTEILQLVIKDPNYVKNGSVICNCELPISTLCHGQTKDTWIPLQTGTKKAGELHILATLRQQQPNLQQNEATLAIQPNTQQSTNKSFEFNIRVKAGKDLFDAQTFGKQDPFCKVTIGDKTFQTRVHDNGGRNPKWDEAFVFRLTDPHLDQLTIHIEDSNTVSNSSIGTCQLPVSIWSGGRSVEQWYPVNHGGKQRGEILLAVQLVEVSATGGAAVPLALASGKGKAFELSIRVKAGKDLFDAQTFGKQDPFCKVTIGDKTFQTRVHDNGGRNPKWDEAFVFRLTDPHLDQLTIHIEDSNTVSNSSIGTCQLPVSIWSGGRSVEQWYPVNHGGKQRGEILLAVQLVEVSATGASA